MSPAVIQKSATGILSQLPCIYLLYILFSGRLTFNYNFIVNTKNHVYTILLWCYNSDVENASFPSFYFRAK